MFKKKSKEIYIVHYHLHKGGVSSVIKAQIDALLKLSYKVGLIVGAPLESNNIDSKVKTIVLPQIAYTNNDNTSTAANIEKIVNLFQKIGKNKIFHIHNHNLGKNPALTYAVYLLALKGFSFVLHIHDFSEDRPDNYKTLYLEKQDIIKTPLHEVLYPIKKNVVYTVLTHEDKGRLIKFGIPMNKVFIIPNPIKLSSEQVINPQKNKIENREKVNKTFAIKKNKNLIIYPIRAIPRKNIGEILLLSILFGKDYHFFITQPPTNKKYLDLYNHWKKLSTQHNLNIHFEAGQRIDFEILLNAADFAISTSIKEGFGLSFLEPWLLETPVVGRRLNNSCNDFEVQGLTFSSLYNQIKVNKFPDFGFLSIEDQSKIISNCILDNNLCGQILNQNSNLKNLFTPPTQSLIQRNKEIIKSIYSTSKFGENLNDIYKRVLG
ncbi:MAG: glycosyltransferase family 4 protein [Bacteroidales bacterium]